MQLQKRFLSKVSPVFEHATKAKWSTQPEISVLAWCPMFYNVNLWIVEHISGIINFLQNVRGGWFFFVNWHEFEFVLEHTYHKRWQHWRKYLALFEITRAFVWMIDLSKIARKFNAVISYDMFVLQWVK